MFVYMLLYFKGVTSKYKTFTANDYARIAYQ